MSRQTIGSVRTDLALEAVEELKTRTDQVPSGVLMDQYQAAPGVHVTQVDVLDESAAQDMGKPIGTYITIESQALKSRNRTVQDRMSETLSDSIQKMLKEVPDDAPILVVGLGNQNATPDALGPRVVNLLLVTRHLKSLVPEDLSGKLRSTAAISPGVLGTTGIESEEIIEGILSQIDAGAVLAIDALAAREVNRLFTTVQLTDTGIHPGAGVGNDRPPIDQNTLGVPVIALGIPTVVHALTIATQTVGMLVEKLQDNDQFSSMIGDMSAAGRANLIGEVLSPVVGDMIVTPKEIDVIMREAAQVVAKGINAAIHTEWDEESIAEMMA